MIWQHPLAWVGALAVALPIAIHLLGRGHAKVYRFPTLRFVRTSRLLPTRRTRVHDPLLLALRCAILLLAAGALAQPLISRAVTRDVLRNRVVRAVVLDTSASMHLSSDSVRAIAQRETRGAGASVVIGARSPAAAIAPASRWLDRQSGRREIVVISDFARGSMDSAAIAEVPGATGIRLVRTAHDTTRVVELRSVRGDSVISAALSLMPEKSTVEWRAGGRASSPSPAFLGTPAEVADASVSLRAAGTLGAGLSVDSSHHISIVLPGYAARVPTANSPREAWMVPVLSQVPADVRAVQADSGAHATLLLFCDAPAASMRCASLIVAALRGAAPAINPSELEPEIIPDGTLRTWERAPGEGTEVRRAGDWLTGPSNARWLWGAVLVLLGIETLLRRDRARREQADNGAARDLAA